MTDKPDKWVEAVTNLIKLTQSGELKWYAGRADDNIGREDHRIETVFQAEYKNKTLRLFKYSYMVEEPGRLERLIRSDSSLYLGTKRKYPYWTSSITLEFIDEAARPLWTFPHTNALNDLFEAVQYQVAGVDEFLKEIL